jgi:hypothetical protein
MKPHKNMKLADLMYGHGSKTLSQLRDPLGGNSSVVELRDDDRLAE